MCGLSSSVSIQHRSAGGADIYGIPSVNSALGFYELMFLTRDWAAFLISGRVSTGVWSSSVEFMVLPFYVCCKLYMHI